MKTNRMFTTVSMGFLLFAGVSPSAGYAAEGLDITSGDSALTSTTTVENTRKTQFEFGFRGKHQSMPDSLIDIWFHRPGKDAGFHIERPKVRAYSTGVEFVVKQKPTDEKKGTSNGIFYIDYFKNLTEEGYWDDVEDDNGPVYDDGDYIVPSDDFSFVVLGANYAYEAHIVQTSQTKGAFGLSFLAGAGLGVGVLMGDLVKWDGHDGSMTSIERYEAGLADDGLKRVPTILPVLDINVGLRFNFADRIALRVEGGFHNMFYSGATLGVMF